MDFGELSDALGNTPVWIFLSSVIVAAWEVATNADFLEPSVITQFISPIAWSAGLDMVTPDVYRACLRKLLAERFLPLARMLRDAYLMEPLEFEEYAAHDLFDPITQEHVTHGFRINGAGTTVVSLSNLVTWVLTNGLRSPSGYGSILSLQRVRHFGVPFPATSPIFLQHVNMCDETLSIALDSIVEMDSLQTAHASVNRIVDDWQAQTDEERADVLLTLEAFMDFWGVPQQQPIVSMLAASLAPQPMQGHVQVWGPGGLAVLGLPALQILIPPQGIMLGPQMLVWGGDEEEEQLIDTGDENDVDTDDEDTEEDGDGVVIVGAGPM
jgi:hypothetical protein